MKFFCIIMMPCFMAMLEGCHPNDELYTYNDMKAYSGVWRDTILSANDVYVEELTIKDNSIRYSLFNADTHVILDTLSGTIVIGNENKIGWNCISPIINKTRQLDWDVLDLSPYQMTLYSNTYGERNYKKVHYSTIEEERIQNRLQNVVRDTLMEMLQYQDYLPLHKNDLIEKFGDYNRLVNCKGLSYFTHHPIFDKISFTENFDNDSLYSYSLSIRENSWYKSASHICSKYMKLRDVNGATEYIDADKLENSSKVIIVDSVSQYISFSPIKDYDFWPNVSRYLNMTIQKIKEELEQKYVYVYHIYPENGTREFQFQTSKDGICSTIDFITDSMGIVHSCSVSLFKQYMRTKKSEAVKEEEGMACFLKKKYFFSMEDSDENGNKVYYFHSFNASSGAMMEIKLRLKYYQHGISNLCCVAIDYRKL